MTVLSKIFETERLSVGISLITALVLGFLLLPDFMSSANTPKKPDQKPSLKKMEQPMLMEVLSLPPPPAVAELKATETPSTKERPEVEKSSTVPESRTKKEHSVVIDKKSVDVVSEGRVLLKLLETGKGPNVEIAWPANSSERDALYKILSGCLGLQSGFLDKNGGLYVAGGVAGRPAAINVDEISLFLRQTVGDISGVEREILAQIRQHHGLQDAQSVRLFSRVVDAALLGGLFRLLPGGAEKEPHIQATYHLEQSAVIIHRITVGGQPVSGLLNLNFGLLGKC